MNRKISCKGGRRAATLGLCAGLSFAALPALADDCEVKLGVVGPMTGGGAPWGLSEKAATEFEAAWTNAHGGLQVGDHKCKVSVVSVDTQSTVAGGAAASNTLASQNIFAINGPIPSNEVAGFRPVAKRNKQVWFTPTFKVDAISPDFPNGFHKVQTPPVWGPLVVKAIKERFDVKSAVVVGPNDEGGTDAGNALAKNYEAGGVTARTEWYQRGTTNFAPLALRIAGMNVDAVEVGPMPPGEAGLLAKQLLEAGYPGAIGKLGAGAEPIIKDVGGIENLKKFYWFDHIPTQDPGVVKLKAEYESLMKGPPPQLALWINDEMAAEQLLKAISIAGTDQDGDKIAAALRSMTPESRYLGKAPWRGKAQYGVNQEFSFPVGLNTVTDGKLDPQVRIEIPTE